MRPYFVRDHSNSSDHDENSQPNSPLDISPDITNNRDNHVSTSTILLTETMTRINQPELNHKYRVADINSTKPTFQSKLLKKSSLKKLFVSMMVICLLNPTIVAV